ncbi:MAG: YeeE/YedE family protein [Polyangia bacterium]
MNNFTPLPALIGGLLIGSAAALMLLLKGRIAGISGIVGGLLQPSHGDTSWRGLFILGLMAAPLILLATGRLPQMTNVASDRTLILAGLLVGFGTRLGSGCTSGHGVCGLARRSKRSLVATLVFMASGALTVWVVRHVIGGAP